MVTAPTVVVLVPGMPGSRLVWPDPDHPTADGVTIWPPGLEDAEDGYQWNPELRSEFTEVDGLITTAGCSPLYVINIYQQLLDDLGKWGFKEEDGSLVVFPYDWRRSAIDLAGELEEKISEIVGNRPTPPTIAILTHSFGGLIARYYIEAEAPNPQVIRLIMMATPNRGAPFALLARMGGVGIVDEVKGIQVGPLADDPRYPALYQVAPTRGDDFAYVGTDVNVDVYDPANLLLPTDENRAAAVALQSKLDPTKRGNVEYFCFYGKAHPTYSKVYLTAINPGHGFELNMALTNQIRDAEGNTGDDTVPEASAYLSGLPDDHYNGESTADHRTIFQDDKLRIALAKALGKLTRLIRSRHESKSLPRRIVLSMGETVMH